MKDMHIIGITGGVGAGKSEVLNYLNEACPSKVIFADEVAKNLTDPGGECFDAVLDIFGREVLLPDGRPDRKKIGEFFFKDASLRERFDGVVHPAVKRALKADMEEAGTAGKYRFYFLEAALLIEEGYQKICEELWYIYASEEVRRKRLKESRGYSDEKINGIMRSQLSEEEFKKHARVVIDNSGDFKDTKEQLERELNRLGGSGEQGPDEEL